MKKIIFLVALLLCQYVYTQQKGQSIPGGCSLEEWLLFQRRPRIISEDRAWQIIRGYVDTSYIKDNESATLGEYIKYQWISTFPPKTKRLEYIEKTYLKRNHLKEIRKWQTDKVLLTERIITDNGIIRWWIIVFALSFLFSFGLGKKKDLSTWAVLGGFWTVFLGTVVHAINIGNSPQGFFIWPQLGSTILASLIGIGAFWLIQGIKDCIAWLKGLTLPTARI